MNEELKGVIIGVAVAGAMFAVAVRIAVGFFRGLFSRSVSEQEMIQAEINARAGQLPVGPGAGIGERRGFNWLVWFIVGCVLAYLLIFSAHGEAILAIIRNRMR